MQINRRFSRSFFLSYKDTIMLKILRNKNRTIFYAKLLPTIQSLANKKNKNVFFLQRTFIILFNFLNMYNFTKDTHDMVVPNR